MGNRKLIVKELNNYWKEKTGEFYEVLVYEHSAYDGHVGYFQQDGTRTHMWSEFDNDGESYIEEDDPLAVELDKLVINKLDKL